MAISILQPAPKTCAYGDVFAAFGWIAFVVESDQIAQPNFYYRLTIKDNYNGVSAQNTAVYKLFPDAYGKGKFDVSEFVKVMLQPLKVPQTVKQENTTSSVLNNGLRSFFVEVAEVYGTTPTVHDTETYQFTAIRSTPPFLAQNNKSLQGEGRIFIDATSEGGVNPYGDNDQTLYNVDETLAMVAFNMATADPTDQEASIDFVRVKAFDNLDSCIGAYDFVFKNNKNEITAFKITASMLENLLTPPYYPQLSDIKTFTAQGGVLGAFTSKLLPVEYEDFTDWGFFNSDTNAVTVSGSGKFTSPAGNVSGFAKIFIEGVFSEQHKGRLQRFQITTDSANSIIGDGDFQIVAYVYDRVSDTDLMQINFAKTDFATDITKTFDGFLFSDDFGIRVIVTNTGTLSTTESVFSFKFAHLYDESETTYFLPETFTFKPAPCEPITQFVYVAQSGAIKGIAATLRNQRSSEVKRSSYQSDPLYQSNFNINPTAYGATVYDVQAPEKFTVTTDWIKDEERKIWEELLLSPDVCVYENYLIPIVIQNANWVEGTQKNEKCWNLTIEYKKSVDRPTVR
jgi:hypothetical protein